MRHGGQTGIYQEGLAGGSAANVYLVSPYTLALVEVIAILRERLAALDGPF